MLFLILESFQSKCLQNNVLADDNRTAWIIIHVFRYTRLPRYHIGKSRVFLAPSQYRKSEISGFFLTDDDGTKRNVRERRYLDPFCPLTFFENASKKCFLNFGYDCKFLSKKEHMPNLKFLHFNTRKDAIAVFPMFFVRLLIFKLNKITRWNFVKWSKISTTPYRSSFLFNSLILL